MSWPFIAESSFSVPDLCWPVLHHLVPKCLTPANAESAFAGTPLETGTLDFRDNPSSRATIL